MGQYKNVECTLTTCIPDNAVKLVCDYQNAINNVEICQKAKRRHIHAFRSVVEHTIKALPTVIKSQEIATAKVVEQFGQIVFVL